MRRQMLQGREVWVSSRLLDSFLLLWGMSDILASPRERDKGRDTWRVVLLIVNSACSTAGKATLHVVYFPPISICEQNGKERKSRCENRNGGRWWRENKSPSLFPSPCHYLCFSQSKLIPGWVHATERVLFPLL